MLLFDGSIEEDELQVEETKIDKRFRPKNLSPTKTHSYATPFLPVFTKPLLYQRPNTEGAEAEIDAAVASPLIAITKTILKISIQRYMDNRPQLDEVLVERAREYLIAISYYEPESFSCLNEPEILNGENNIAVENKVETVVDELRSKLISIASYAPTMDCADNNCNGYGEV
ncbi:hypothetical protein L6452_16487 [Arctium lappa]|uniref:Uncharacterized protein n=1 Tax=Arctium lappa TaxID=4217 RepID=A0ACB9C0S9_ARCLA|nr:hypothetical protein L6452_16487 [Arctium lappa]